MRHSFFNKAALVGICALTLGACSSSIDDEGLEIANKGAQSLYEDAKEALSVGNYSVAAQTLSALDSRYPFGPLSNQVQLDLIYAYHKTGKSAEALATIDRFVRLNPNHSDVDYAMYMRGLVNMDSDTNFFQELVNISRADRDATTVKEAFNDFRNLIDKYPDSKYAADARKRMLFIKDRLARYEIAVARYYIKRQAYVAAANRGQYVIEHFADTNLVQEALEIMVYCYRELGLDELHDNTLETLRLNYPNSELIG